MTLQVRRKVWLLVLLLGAFNLALTFVVSLVGRPWDERNLAVRVIRSVKYIDFSYLWHRYVESLWGSGDLTYDSSEEKWFYLMSTVVCLIAARRYFVLSKKGKQSSPSIDDTRKTKSTSDANFGDTAQWTEQVRRRPHYVNDVQNPYKSAPAKTSAKPRTTQSGKAIRNTHTSKPSQIGSGSDSLNTSSGWSYRGESKLLRAFFGPLPQDCPICGASDIPDYNNFPKSVFLFNDYEECRRRYRHRIHYWDGSAHICWAAMVVRYADRQKLSTFCNSGLAGGNADLYRLVLSGRCRHAFEVNLNNENCAWCKKPFSNGEPRVWMNVAGDEVAKAHASCHDSNPDEGDGFYSDPRWLPRA